MLTARSARNAIHATAVTPSRESEGVTAACSVALCVIASDSAQ